ncbi:hypothetical protein SAMD00023353_2600220 [Rosellinia necatrix]|uniref:Uncharacterized protein n=1 Tax=Rosellinia necatrix TaxID=77044 RepID=A0A1S8A8C7_ROSNE|nr:hypothetical protein SAMD00023353_2600220 [Rosellinia necatrix]
MPPAHKVGFAVVPEPGRAAVDRTAADRIGARRESMPGPSIKPYTDYAPLLHQPILIPGREEAHLR